jgi:hypothetical protein
MVESPGGRSAAGGGNDEDEEDEDDDLFEQEMNRIRGPRLIKGEAIALPEFPITNEGDFGISIPCTSPVKWRGSSVKM